MNPYKDQCLSKFMDAAADVIALRDYMVYMKDHYIRLQKVYAHYDSDMA